MQKPQLQSQFFNPRELGRSLKEVATELIKTESQDVVSRWFHSANDLDLFIWIDARKNIIKQQLSFHGQIVEWNLIEGVKTGYIFEDETQMHASQPQSELVKYDETLQKRTLEQALQIVSFVEDLTEADKQGVVENFLKDPSLGNLSPEVFLEKYKRYTQKTSPPLSFWARLRHKIGRWFS